MTRRKPSNEKTSKRVAAIAGRILSVTNADDSFMWIDAKRKWHMFEWADIRALAASCLNQAPDKPKQTPAKRKIRKRGKT